MVMCFVPGCSHYSEQKTCKFIRFPLKEEERKKWLQLIRRDDREPSKSSLVCSCHFIDGDKKNGPTIFDFNKKRKFAFVSPEKRTRTAAAVKCPSSAVINLTSALEDPAPNPMPATSASPAQYFESIPGTAIGTAPEPIPGPSSTPDPDPGTSNTTTQTPSISRSNSLVSNASADAEIFFLTEKVRDLTMALDQSKARFSFHNIKGNDKYVALYTGIPTTELFFILHEMLSGLKLKYYSGWNVEKIDKIDQLFLTLIKLRLNFPHQDLAIRFNCSTATITNVFMTYLHALHEILFAQFLHMPSRQKNMLCLPTSFCNFMACRVILDCTEVATVVPKSMEKQRLTYSSYKHKNTWKGLVGVAPNGVITFVSKLYPGSLSDKKIVEHCEILNKMQPGDLILADKGFLINDMLPRGVSVNIPPFLTTPQFTPSQVVETKRIARARIHVERAIRRIKCYSILDKIPQFLIPQSSIIFQVCASLTNLSNPLIKEVEDFFQ